MSEDNKAVPDERKRAAEICFECARGVERKITGLTPERVPDYSMRNNMLSQLTSMKLAYTTAGSAILGHNTTGSNTHDTDSKNQN